MVLRGTRERQWAVMENGLGSAPGLGQLLPGSGTVLSPLSRDHL